jgi:hypothetical protein
MILTIRRQQMDALALDYRARLTVAFAAHLREHFPDRFADCEEHDLRREVERQVAKAKSYGLVTPRDHCRFLNLGATFGWDFDTAPPTRFIADVLRNERLGDPSERLDLAVQDCLAFLFRGVRREA